MAGPTSPWRPHRLVFLSYCACPRICGCPVSRGASDNRKVSRASGPGRRGPQALQATLARVANDPTMSQRGDAATREYSPQRR